MARSIECRCEYNFTCGYCLRNAKPYFTTLSNGSAIYNETPFTDSILRRLAAERAKKLEAS